jgi:hypothetical protein
VLSTGGGTTPALSGDSGMCDGEGAYSYLFFSRPYTSLVRCYFLSTHPPLPSSTHTRCPVSRPLVVVNTLLRKTAMHQHLSRHLAGAWPSLVPRTAKRRRSCQADPPALPLLASCSTGPRPVVLSPDHPSSITCSQSRHTFPVPVKHHSSVNQRRYILINFLLHSSGTVPYPM